MPTAPPKKGEEIRIVGGTYAGSKGWRDANNPDTPCMASVIVVQKGLEFQVRVRKEYVDSASMPKNRAKAILLEHADITKLMTKTCKDLASCKLKKADLLDLTAIFAQMLLKAALANRGSKARYRTLEFDGVEEDDLEDAFDKE